MTTTEHPAQLVPAGVRRRGRQLPLVAAVGSPFDEWSTVALPVAAPAALDPATIALSVVAPVVSAGAVVPA